MSENEEREAVSARLATLGEAEKSWISAFLDKPQNDDTFLDGLHHYLDGASQARFLNALKLEKTGEWLGHTAPGRLQIRIMEAARSSQHPAYQALRSGLSRSGGLERAYPKASL